MSISRQEQGERWTLVHSTETQPKGLTKDIEWREFKLPISSLCNKQPDLPLKLEIFVM